MVSIPRLNPRTSRFRRSTRARMACAATACAAPAAGGVLAAAGVWTDDGPC